MTVEVRNARGADLKGKYRMVLIRKPYLSMYI